MVESESAEGAQVTEYDATVEETHIITVLAERRYLNMIFKFPEIASCPTDCLEITPTAREKIYYRRAEIQNPSGTHDMGTLADR